MEATLDRNKQNKVQETDKMEWKGTRRGPRGAPSCHTRWYTFTRPRRYILGGPLQSGTARRRVGRPQTNGFVERFKRTLFDEFFRVAFREKFYDSVEGLQKDLDKYLQFYNTERPHQGYRNMGKRPLDTVEKFVKSSRKKASCTLCRISTFS
jgi:hypothetical protein